MAADSYSAGGKALIGSPPLYPSLVPLTSTPDLFTAGKAHKRVSNGRAAQSGIIEDQSSIQTEPLISPHGPQLMEPTMPYPGSMTLPQMHGWDQMLPQNPTQAKPSSISSMDAPHDLLPYANGSISSNPNTLPPLMERQQSNSDGLPPFNSSSFMNGTGKTKSSVYRKSVSTFLPFPSSSRRAEERARTETCG